MRFPAGGGAMQSIVSGPVSADASLSLAGASGGRPPPRTVSIAFSKVRRLAMITLSVVPRCSRVRSWIAPMLSTAHWSCRLMSSSPMPRYVRVRCSSGSKPQWLCRPLSGA
jgi:hypothetical protein